jgi:GT2 family glycosyltransferase
LTPSASIVIPTRDRPRYLKVALASIAPQAAAAGAEVLVVDDAGPSPAIQALAGRHGARYEPHPEPLGLNVARNTGVARSGGQLVVFVDDDVEVCPGWLEALLRAAREHPDAQVFTGPIRPRLEGPGGWARRSCGREGPPITALDLGPHDTDEVRYAWGANMAVRRGALERVGPFDVTLRHGGDEQEWQDRLTAGAPGGLVRYVAAAALDHRRSGPDARLPALARGAQIRGRAARRFDARRGKAPALAGELRTLALCAGHVVRRRCPAGLTMVAHSTGRLQEGLRERLGLREGLGEGLGHAAPVSSGPAPPIAGIARATDSEQATGDARDDFLSGESGAVGGFDAVRREAGDRLIDGWELISGQRLRLRRAARWEPPRRRVLVLGIQRPRHHDLSAAIEAELLRSRHEVVLRLAAPGDRGKFENLNGLLEAEAQRDVHSAAERQPGDRAGAQPAGNTEAQRDGHAAQSSPDVGAGPIANYDWLLVIDDDVVLPGGFLDRFLFLAERLDFDLVQPAHRARSHAAWRVTRRRRGVVARETPFVEIGPVTAFARGTFSTLLPFPALRMGWGLDLHWAALARERRWRCGVLDAVPIRHSAAPAADAYSREAAIAEARAFLADRPHLSAREAQHTLFAHRAW